MSGHNTEHNIPPLAIGIPVSERISPLIFNTITW